MRIDIEPFRPEHIGAAASLLAQRHERHRLAEPALAPIDAPAALDQAWRRPRTSGAVALDDGAVIGYLIGSLRDNDTWSTHLWVERAGCAATDAEVVRDVYAAAVMVWVDAGALLHLVNVPATAEDLDPWYRLGFGQMQLHAMRESGAAETAPPPGVLIRVADVSDVDALVRATATLIWEEQVGAPALTGLPRRDPDELRSDWLETLEDPSVTCFVAELDATIVGHVLLYPAEPEFGTPLDAVVLSTAAVVPGERGSGVGSALTAHALRWAEEAGHSVVVADWRVPNLSSSRFWPRRGFRPTFHRLHRRVLVG